MALQTVYVDFPIEGIRKIKAEDGTVGTQILIDTQYLDRMTKVWDDTQDIRNCPEKWLRNGKPTHEWLGHKIKQALPFSVAEVVERE